VQRFTFFALAVLLGACAGEPFPNSAADHRARQAALEKARKAIAERGWPLPADHKAAVERSTVTPEVQDSWDEYVVTFTQPRPNKSAAPLYSVNMLCSTGAVTGIYDQRKNVQAEEIAAERHAFELKFRLTRKDYTLTAGAQERAVVVTFMFDKVARVPGRLTPERTVVAVVV
jgi:hypothetical protein